MSELKTFTIAHPRDFDGNPFEVASRAVAQVAGVVHLAREAVGAAELMARNAEMTRRIDLGGQPEGDKWTETPQGRNWQALRDELDAVEKRLRTMKMAAGFDPKHPPRTS